MNRILNSVLGMVKKLGYVALRYAYIVFYWKLKFFKIQLQKWKKCSAQKQVSKACSDLGAEIYSLHKQEETDWQRFPLVQQLLKQVEEAESSVFEVDAVIGGIDNDYLKKKEALREEYASKQSEAGRGSSEE